jgi:hypothetical protein
MSWSLQTRGGDLVISGARLGQSFGGQKLVQDLRAALLEHRGNDDMHPSFGSLIDGGIDDSGNEVASLIGTVDWDFAALRIDSEIRRITSDHQRQQAQRARNDRTTYGESTLTNDELLVEVQNVDMTRSLDKLLVQITVSTGTNQTATIDLPLNLNA